MLVNSEKKSLMVIEEFHLDGCDDTIVRKSFISHPKRNLPETVLMSRVQTSSSDAD